MPALAWWGLALLPLQRCSGKWCSKYAKAALLRQASVALATVKTSHEAASRMLLALRRQKGAFALLGGAKVWEDVLWVIVALEAAHPQLAPPEGPQLEYSWENADGAIQWPALHLRVARVLGDSKRASAPRILRFAERLNHHSDAMFP